MANVKLVFFLRLFLAFLFCNVAIQCASNKNVYNANPSFENISKSDFKDYIVKKVADPPIIRDTVSITKTVKGIPLNNNAIELLKLNHVDGSFNKAFLLKKINISPNFTSLILSLNFDKNDITKTYLLNYDKEFRIVGKCLIFLDINGSSNLSSRIKGNQIELTEAFVDQGHAIIQSWSRRIDDTGSIK